MESKILKGLKALTTENNITNGGGLSSLVVPRKLNKTGAALVVGGTMAVGLGSAGIQSRNKATLGKVSYGDGPARMTGSFTSGGVEAMHRIANGNIAVFQDLAEETVTHGSIGGAIENYGATPELISALYNMGGR